MGEIVVTVPAKYIAALMLFVDGAESRTYLRGIYFEIGASEMRLCAANGHQLVVVRYVHNEDSGLETPINVIAPMQLFDGVKPKLSTMSLLIQITNHGAEDASISVNDVMQGATRTAPPLKGTFPDYRQVIPRKVSGKTGWFSTTLLQDFSKARDVLFGKKSNGYHVEIGHNGNDAALITIGDPDFIGVLMPITQKDDKPAPNAPPAWVYEDLSQESLV